MPIERPVKAPYRSEVHTAAWEAWDNQIEKLVAEGADRKRVDTTIHRMMFIDGFISGLNA